MMRDLSPEDEIVACKNCGKHIPPASQFCPNCSQRYTTGKVNFKDLIAELIDNFFQWDARWLKTIRYLFWPGKLTKEFFIGRHRSYIHPIRVFLVATAIFIYLFSQFIAKNDDEQLMESSEFKIRLYKNYLLNEIDQLRLRQDSLSGKPSDPAYQLVVNKIASLKNEVKIQFDTTATIAGKADAVEDDADEPDAATAKKSKKGKRRKSEDPYFYLEVKDEILKLNKVEFEESQVAVFLKKHPIRLDTPEQFKIASMRRMKARGDYHDTIDFVDYIHPSHALSYITDWSDPLEVSVRFVGSDTYAVALEDIRNMPIDQIVEKFKIDRLVDRLFLKQLIKFNLDIKSYVGFLVGTILWILLFFVPFMALVLKLFYIRQKRYYIEHVVYLLHYHTILLLVFSMMILLEDFDFGPTIEAGLLAYAGIILPFGGLKYYYQQSWAKTLVKGSMLGVIYLIMIMVFIFFGLLIGFFFY